MKPYEVISTTADTGIRCWGLNYRDLLANILKGLNHLLFEDLNSGNGPEKTEKIPLEIKGDSYENLIVKLLNEILFLWETSRQISRRLEIRRISSTHLEGILHTLFTDATPGVEIKGVTYHKLKIKNMKRGRSITIIFDI